tara:strand:- start:41 stop:811 length:771 start_codon:yes stop_codon:yes gene_type:complete
MNTTIKLLTIADGFGDSIAVPAWYPNYIKWPEIIKLMTRGVELTNLSRYGAGNEYIIQCLRNNLTTVDIVLIQWAIPNRLDLILSHSPEYTEFWNQQINNDPVYNNNVVQLNNNRVWITSGSAATGVREYHKKFIGHQQHQLRSQLYVEYATLMLAQLQHGFLLTNNSEYLRETVSNIANWYWHDQFCGMSEFRHQSKYGDLELGLAQPIPLVHFDFIRQFIQPYFDLPWRSEKEIQAVEIILYRKYKESIKNKPI